MVISRRRLLLALAASIASGRSSAYGGSGGSTPTAAARQGGRDKCDAPLGQASPLGLTKAVREASKRVVRLVWEKGNNGATGIVLDGDWLLCAGHSLTSPQAAYGVTAILAFEEDIPTELRTYLVLRPDLGFVRTIDASVIDFALCRISPAIPSRPFPMHLDVLTGGSIDQLGSQAVGVCAVAHPQTKCGTVTRRAAFKDFRDIAIWKSEGNHWTSDARFCRGASGGAVFDASGNLLALISTQGPEAKFSQLVAMSDVKAYLITNSALGSVEWFRRDFVPASVRGTHARELPSNCRESGITAPTDLSGLNDEDMPLPQQQMPLHQRAARCVGYLECRGNILLWGTCFRVGREWILTAKHVVDSPGHASMYRVNFQLFTQKDYLDDKLKDTWINLCADAYYSSDDRIFSFDGVESVLDYALIRMDTNSPGFKALDDQEYLHGAVHSGSHPAPMVTIGYRHLGNKVAVRVAEVTADNPELKWHKIYAGDQPHANWLLAGDTRRLYYIAAANAGHSGAPILDAQYRVIGMHTNSRLENCSTNIAEEFRDRFCAQATAVDRANRERVQLVHQLSFGSKIEAIARDLSFRHRLDLSAIEGLKDVLSQNIPRAVAAQ